MTIRSALRQSGLYLLDIAYPNRCPCCAVHIRWNELVCRSCREKLEPAAFCRRCGRAPCCCEATDYEKAYIGFVYKGAAVRGIAEIKSSGSKNFVYYSVDSILSRYGKPDADLITYAPIRGHSLVRRGYNQAKCVAKYLSRKTGIPTCSCFSIANSAKVQHKLTAGARAVNAESISAALKCDVSGKSIIICDDVITTGSTLNRCAGLLLEAGAASVQVLACTGTTLLNER